MTWATPARLQARKKQLQRVEAQLLWNARHRAKKRGVPFDLTIKDIVVPSHCPIFPHIKLQKSNTGEATRTNASPSIDCIIPELGYVKSNIQIISWRANDLKKNGTLEEFIALAVSLATHKIKREATLLLLSINSNAQQE